MTNAIDNKSAKMLIEQYKLRCQEMLVMVPLYKAHVRNFQIIAGAILGGAAFALSRPDLLPTSGNWWLWWAIAAFIPVVATYLMLDILGTIYTMQILAEGISSIERQLNENIGRDLFAWEEQISGPFFTRLWPIPGVVNPGWFVGAFGLLIYFTMAAVVPAVAYASILTANAYLGAGHLVRALIALSSLMSIACCAIVTYTSRTLNGLRPIVRAWMDRIVVNADRKVDRAVKAKNEVSASAPAEQAKTGQAVAKPTMR